MRVVTEGELEITFPAGTHAVRFDGASHGLSHCMKAVDFVVDFGVFYLFLEVKDPDDTTADPARRAIFAQQTAQPVFTRKLTGKFRDTFLYRWSEQVPHKPVKYVVLLQLSGLAAPSYLMLNQALRRELPVNPVPGTWSRLPATSVAVVDMATWNSLGTLGTVRRV